MEVVCIYIGTGYSYRDKKNAKHKRCEKNKKLLATIYS